MSDEDVPEGFAPAAFSYPIFADTGPYFLKRTDACCIVGMRVRDKHCQARGAAHGGVLATLADVALSLQVHLILQPGQFVTTTSLTTNYVRVAKRGAWIEAHTVLDHLGKRNAHVHGRIIDGDDTLITMSGAFAIIGP